MLVDGFVEATWSMRCSTVTIAPFRPLAPRDRAAVEDAAARLVDFVAPEGKAVIAGQAERTRAAPAG